MREYFLASPYTEDQNIWAPIAGNSQLQKMALGWYFAFAAESRESQGLSTMSLVVCQDWGPFQMSHNMNALPGVVQFPAYITCKIKLTRTISR